MNNLIYKRNFESFFWQIYKLSVYVFKLIYNYQ